MFTVNFSYLTFFVTKIFSVLETEKTLHEITTNIIFNSYTEYVYQFNTTTEYS